MPNLQKFNALAQRLANGPINLSSDTAKLILTNTVPVAANSVYADVSGTELANGNGYTTGGVSCTITSSTQTGGVLKYIVAAASPTWTASGSMGPFRYVILYDSVAPGQPLIGWLDYGQSISLAATQTFTVQFDAGLGILQLS